MHIADLHVVEVDLFSFGQCRHSDGRVVPHPHDFKHRNLIIEATENDRLGVRDDFDDVLVVDVLSYDGWEHVSLGVFV